MNQHIVVGSEDRTGHAKRKTDADTRGNVLVELEKGPAGGDISGACRYIAVGGSQDDRKRNGEANSAPNFLPGRC